MFDKDSKPTPEDINQRVAAVKDAMIKSGTPDTAIDDIEVTKMVKKQLLKEHKAKLKAEEEAKRKAEQEQKQADEKARLETQEKELLERVARRTEIKPTTEGTTREALASQGIQIETLASAAPDFPLDNGNGKGGKWIDPIIHYTPTLFALDAHARAILPQDDNLNFIDPLTAHLPTKGLQREKLILDAMSRTLKKPLPPLGYIFIIGIIIILGVVIAYDAVIKDYLDAARDYEIKRELNDLPPNAQPPKLFDFKIPGINR